MMIVLLSKTCVVHHSSLLVTALVSNCIMLSFAFPRLFPFASAVAAFLLCAYVTTGSLGSFYIVVRICTLRPLPSTATSWCVAKIRTLVLKTRVMLTGFVTSAPLVQNA